MGQKPNDPKVLKIIIFNIKQCWPKISLIFHGCVNSALSVSAHHYCSDTIRVKNGNTGPECSREANKYKTDLSTEGEERGKTFWSDVNSKGK